MKEAQIKKKNKQIPSENLSETGLHVNEQLQCEKMCTTKKKPRHSKKNALLVQESVYEKHSEPKTEPKNSDSVSLTKKTIIFGVESVPVLGPALLVGQALSGKGLDGNLSGKERTQKAVEGIVSITPGLGSIAKAILAPALKKGVDFFWKNKK